MKLLFYLLLFCSLVLESSAQNEKYPDCTYAYFKGSKKVSTSICYDKDKRWGKAMAFNSAGKIIFEKEMRNFAGHASVHFSYHPNGTISKADYSSAPDGGIQWYKSTDEFSATGELTHHSEQSHDMRPSIEMPDTYKPDTEKKIEKKETEVVKCAEIYVSEFWFINNSRYMLMIICEHKYIKGEKYVLEIAPGDTVKGGQKILAEQYENPIGSFNISITRAKKKTKKEFKVNSIADATFTVRKGLRKYFFEVR